MATISTSDGIQLNYDLTGDPSKPVLMFSNSLGTNMSMWNKQAEAFSGSFQILRYDTRGHGKSDAPNGPYSLKRLGQDAVEILIALKIESAHFCGLSLGGMTGMWLGAHAANRIHSLCLCCTSAYLPPAEMWDTRIQQVEAHGMASITETVLSRWFTPGFLQSQVSPINSVRDQLLSTSSTGYSGCCAAIRDMDCREILATINKPCLVIAGMNDLATPPDHGKLISDGIPNSSFVAIDNAAHLSNIEQEDTFNASVLNFLLH